VAASAAASSPSFTYIKSQTLKTEGFDVFPDRVPLRRHHQKPRFRTKKTVLAPRRDGDLEEIITIIITDASLSTIHDSPIHV
jgi:hypothetical protein